MNSMVMAVYRTIHCALAPVVFPAVFASLALCPVATRAQCATDPSGLVSWWPAEGNAVDSGSGNNGVLTNVTFASGEVGQAFSFTGSNSAVMVGNPSTLQLGNFSIEGWIARANSTYVSSGPGDGLIFGYGAGGYGFGLHGAGQIFLTDVGANVLNAPFSITDTGFHHVAVTEQDGYVVFYLDGVASATNDYAIWEPRVPGIPSTN